MERKLLRRFYEVLILLRVLNQVQGHRISGHVHEDGNLELLERIDIRRRVMVHLCTMCDYKKGGATVTSIAMEELPAGPRYWIASHGRHNKIKLFLTETLQSLENRALSSAPERGSEAFEKELFERFTSFQGLRIKQYWKLLLQCLESELKRVTLTSNGSGRYEEYTTWLQSFIQCSQDESSLSRLPQLAYSARHSPFLQVGFDPITMQPTAVESQFRKDIRHYIGRLSALRRAAHLLTFASASQPNLFIGFTTQQRKSDAFPSRPQLSSLPTLDGIAGRMLSETRSNSAEFQSALQLLDNRMSLMTRVKEYYEGNDWQPRVHAELVLLEAIFDRKYIFPDGDRYIACSKPACFCCYHYICNHPGSFARPPSHNKIYPNWQPPQVDSKKANENIQQRDVMNALIREVRKAVIEQVMNPNLRFPWHPDSSSGITRSLGRVDILTQLDEPEAHETGYGHSREPSAGEQSSQSIECSSGEESEDGGVPLT